MGTERHEGPPGKKLPRSRLSEPSRTASGLTGKEHCGGGSSESGPSKVKATQFLRNLENLSVPRTDPNGSQLWVWNAAKNAENVARYYSVLVLLMAGKETAPVSSQDLSAQGTRSASVRREARVGGNLRWGPRKPDSAELGKVGAALGPGAQRRAVQRVVGFSTANSGRLRLSPSLAARVPPPCPCPLLGPRRLKVGCDRPSLAPHAAPARPPAYMRC